MRAGRADTVESYAGVWGVNWAALSQPQSLRVEKKLQLEWVHVQINCAGAGNVGQAAIRLGQGAGDQTQQFYWEDPSPGAALVSVNYDMTWPKGQGPVVYVARLEGFGTGSSGAIRIVGREVP
jgi:hypothetical protein